MNEHFRKNEEEMIQHIKYSKDPISFIRDNRVGDNKSFKYELLPLYEFEEKILNSIHENELNIIKKSRQMHMSTLMAAYCAWKLIFTYDYTISVVTPNLKSSIEFIDKVRIILQNYSNDVFHWEDDFIVNNKSEIRLSNSSMIKGFAPDVNAGRGYTTNMLIMDEMDHMKNAEHIWSAFIFGLKALEGSKCILCSTPSKNGLKIFHRMWVDAVTDSSKFIPKEIDWTMNPQYNKDMKEVDGEMWSPWFEEQCKILGGDTDSIDTELWGKFVTIGKPSSYMVNFRVDSELYNKIINKTKDESSVSDYIRDLIKKDLSS